MTVMQNSPQTMPTDSDLIHRCLSGHPADFNELVRRYENRLYRFLLRTARQWHDVEDAAQQAFIKAHQSLSRYDHRYAFSTWLFTIAIRELRAISRKRNRRTALSLESANSVADPGQTIADDFDSPGEVWSLARRILSENQSTVLWMRYGESLAVKEIAQILSRPRIWVSVTLLRACATLKKVLEKQNQHGVLAGGVL